MGFGPLLEDKLCLIFKLAPSVCRMTFPILASLLVRLVVLLPFQLLRLSLATPSRWTPLALSVFLHCLYVNKKSDMDLAAKGLGAKEWNNSLKTKLSLLPKKLFRIRMSRNFGMKMLTMTNLSTECLIQLTKLGYDATPF